MPARAGVLVVMRRLWTPEENKLFDDLWGKVPLSELAAQVNRTPAALEARAYAKGRMGTKKKPARSPAGGKKGDPEPLGKNKPGREPKAAPAPASLPDADRALALRLADLELRYISLAQVIGQQAQAIVALEARINHQEDRLKNL